MKTLIITLKNNGTKKIQIPDGAKITYGSICPGTKRNYNDDGGPSFGLRIYGKNKEDQLACFTDVKEWRVEDIKVLKKEVKKASKNILVNEEGVERMQRVTATTEEWVDEDADSCDRPLAEEAFSEIKQLLPADNNDF